jgi:hypothetical protein
LSTSQPFTHEQSNSPAVIVATRPTKIASGMASAATSRDDKLTEQFAAPARVAATAPRAPESYATAIRASALSSCCSRDRLVRVGPPLTGVRPLLWAPPARTPSARSNRPTARWPGAGPPAHPDLPAVRIHAVRTAGPGHRASTAGSPDAHEWRCLPIPAESPSKHSGQLTGLDVCAGNDPPDSNG